MMSSDVLDILDLGSGSNKKGFLNKDALLAKADKKISQKTRKRPQNIPRELWGLQNTFKNELPPLMPTDDDLIFKKPKVNLASSKWLWTPFQNQARKDGLILYHWKQKSDLGMDAEYQFAKYDKHVEVPSFTDEEFTKLLTASNWTLEKTRHLFELAQRFELNFIHIQDRWDVEKFSPRPSIEDLKERYYNILSILDNARGTNLSQGLKYDANHERKRKKQLNLLYGRTREELEEEEVLSSQLKIIENRRREREKKQQDLEKIIYQGKLITEGGSGEASVLSGDNLSHSGGHNHSSSGVKSKVSSKVNKKRGSVLATSEGPGAVQTSMNILGGLSASQNEISTVLRKELAEECLTGSSNLCLQDLLKVQGCHLRSQYLKTPQNIGQKKIRLLDNLMSYLGLEQHPPSSSDIIKSYNSLRSNIILLFSLRSALITCDCELASFRLKINATEDPNLFKNIPQDVLDDLAKIDGNEESLNLDPEILTGLKLANSKKLVITRPMVGFPGPISAVTGNPDDDLPQSNTE